MMTMQEGSAYVRERRALGETILQIATVLAVDGWQHDDIVKAFESAEAPLGTAASVAPATPIAPVSDPVPDPIVPVVAPIAPEALVTPIVPIAPIEPITLAAADEIPDVGLPPPLPRTTAMLVTPLSGIKVATLPPRKRWHPLRVAGWILVILVFGGLFGGEVYAYENNMLGVLKPYVAEYLPFLPQSL